MLDKIKEFKPTSWSIDNKTTIFILCVFLTLAGLLYYQKLPKESFPEVKVPTIYVMTVYAGASPTDMENAVSKPLEKQFKAISGVKKITSNSIENFNNVVVEFNTNVKTDVALQKVKDAIDKAKKDLPQKLDQGPDAQEVNFSEFPIMSVNIAGNDLKKLKEHADDLKDRIEAMKEITRVDMVGALDREIQIDVDMNKMQALQLTLGDIQRAVQMENMNLSGGTVTADGKKQTLVVRKEFKSVNELKRLVVGSQAGAMVYLEDVADVRDGFKEKESYARLDGKDVVTLNVIKRAGENLIDASDKINAEIKKMQANHELPEDVKVTVTGDQSDQTRVTLHDLINTIIIGFILVLTVLMFFMGSTNSFFVALSVPLSMFIAFMVLYWLGWSMNMIVLFSFLLALGIVVDDAIVVIENTHRIFLENKGLGIVRSAKLAAGEVFLPVLSGTLTTLAPFIPLAFWDGMIGQFMLYLPITLIITLLASLVVAYIINPVFAVQFMRHYDPKSAKDNRIPRWMKRFMIGTAALALILYVTQHHGFANFTILILILVLLHHFVLRRMIFGFQEKTWPRVREWYGRKLTWAIDHPKTIIFSTIGLFIFSFVLLGIRQPKVDFFPAADPNFIYAYIEMPVGTDQIKTDSVTRDVENRMMKLIGQDTDIVTSVIANVAFGAGDPRANDLSIQPHKAKISVAFKQFADRKGKSTSTVLKRIQDDKQNWLIPDAQIVVEQEQGGPPVGKPVSIEITGEKLESLIDASSILRSYLDSINIAGVEKLRSDIQDSKPEMVFNIDRERANREGISTGQIGMEIRNGVLGAEVSKFRDVNDEYPIMMRYKMDQRSDINTLQNLMLTYRDMNMGGQIRNVPYSSIGDVKSGTSYGGIKRKNQKRIITLESNVIAGYNMNEVAANVYAQVDKWKIDHQNDFPGIEVVAGGQQQEQAETMSFLGTALLASIGLIVLILVTQFNSIGKPLIILSEILFSVIGVFLGLAIFGMNVSIIMTGIGIVALAGIVVRNGILIVEFIDILKERGMSTREAIIEAGKVRMTPVLLTATATILGLIPLAVGLNIDFELLFTELNPHLFFGGDSVAFWGPLSWTMIFGLGFATILTLIVLPVMYIMSENTGKRLGKLVGTKKKETNHEPAAEEKAELAAEV